MSHHRRCAAALFVAAVLSGVGAAPALALAPTPTPTTASAFGEVAGEAPATDAVSLGRAPATDAASPNRPPGTDDVSTDRPQATDVPGGNDALRGRTPARGGGAGSVRLALAARPDSVRQGQWQLDELHARTAWRYSTGKGVVVGVLDSGVDAKHPDLAGQVLPGLDLVTANRDGRFDAVGHGTTVAGLIAGSNRDDQGVLGLAPDARILPVRVLDADNRYEDAMTVAKGVRWAVDHGARVLNLSLGGIGNSEPLAEALDYAFARDVVVVACTGNVTPSAPTEVWYPAREPGVVAVSGLDAQHGGQLWASSITGPSTVISAPATSLLGARPGGYWRVQGTSFAAPLVSATAALIRSRWPAMSAGNVVNRLIRTARDVGPAGRDESYGFGVLDPVGALTRDVPKVDGNPLDTVPPPGLAGFGPAPGVVDPALGGGPAPPDATDHTGAGADAMAPGQARRSPGSLLGSTALFLVLVAGGALVARRKVARRRR